jgi:ATP-binding cassette subfamily G (WHITE) protein 2 (PDR)
MATHASVDGARPATSGGLQNFQTTRESLTQATSTSETHTFTGETHSRTFSNTAQPAEAGIRRTSSGRDTYYPDGHASMQPFCTHEESRETTSTSSPSRASYTLFPARSTRRSSSVRDMPGAGLFSGDDGQETHTSSGSNTRQVEETVPLEPAEEESPSSSDSSTRFGSNDQRHDKQRRESSSSEEIPGHALERRVSRAVIDDNGRRQLQRIFTSQSNKITQQMSIAQPGDPSVDPANESFDLSKFLVM